MITIAQLVEVTGKDVLDHLDRSAEVPVISQAACQGDVSILRVTTAAATTPMPKTVVVVASEASSNTHTLHPAGECYWDRHEASGAGDVMLGTLTVPEGATAFMSHQEHGGIEIAPGTYRIGRQREFAGEWAYVRD